MQNIIYRYYLYKGNLIKVCGVYDTDILFLDISSNLFHFDTISIHTEFKNLPPLLEELL